MGFRSLLSYFCAMASEPGAVAVRQARPEDVGRLQAIQLAAGNSFRDIGMSAAADTFPLPAESLSGYRRAGRAWVAADEHDEPVGFVVADVVDGSAHIEQVSVHPAHAGQRIGAMLLDYVADWAAEQGMHAMTLITFRGVPWNAQRRAPGAGTAKARDKARGRRHLGSRGAAPQPTGPRPPRLRRGGLKASGGFRGVVPPGWQSCQVVT